MKKYLVDLSFTVSASVEVEIPDDAHDPESDASEAALERAGDATTYAGNGSFSGLAGFRGNGIDVSVSSEVDVGEIRPV